MRDLQRSGCRQIFNQRAESFRIQGVTVAEDPCPAKEFPPIPEKNFHRIILAKTYYGAQIMDININRRTFLF